MLRLTGTFIAAGMFSSLLALTAAAESYAHAAISLNAESEESSLKDELPFQHSADRLADVKLTLEKAKAGNKLGLVIMGANWCHDSRALVSKFEDPELSSILDEHYETVLVDVGELRYGKEVIQNFGIPIIYGTPTVLVIDPVTNRQLNRRDMHQWRDAFSISQADTNAYFRNMATVETRGKLVEKSKNKALDVLLSEVDAFETEQSKRMYEAFALIGPMITMERSERPENFAELWNELRDFRYQITEDLEKLRGEAKRRTEAGESDIRLRYPSYQPFSWETPSVGSE